MMTRYFFRVQVSLLILVPPVAVMLITNDQLVRQYDLSHVTDVMSGGAVLDSSIDDRLFSLFPNILRIGQGCKYLAAEPLQNL
jgi:hypothetical protein